MIYAKKITKLYNNFFKIPDNQIEFISDFLKTREKPGKILDIECGTAQAGTLLAEQGHDLTAIDTHKDFIIYLNKKYKKMKSNCHFYNLGTMDVARFLKRESYDIALCVNSRLLFISDKILFTKFLFDTKIMLAPGGIFVIDIANFNNVNFGAEKITLPTRESMANSLSVSLTRGSLNYSLNVTMTKSRNKEITIIDDEPSYPFTKQTIETAANEVRYSSIEFFSDYRGTPFTENAERLICVLHK